MWYTKDSATWSLRRVWNIYVSCPRFSLYLQTASPISPSGEPYSNSPSSELIPSSSSSHKMVPIPQLAVLDSTRTAHHTGQMIGSGKGRWHKPSQLEPRRSSSKTLGEKVGKEPLSTNVAERKENGLTSPDSHLVLNGKNLTEQGQHRRIAPAAVFISASTFF